MTPFRNIKCLFTKNLSLIFVYKVCAILAKKSKIQKLYSELPINLKKNEILDHMFQKIAYLLKFSMVRKI
jgi:hypothetical protein